jgi:DNA polymerase-1
MADIVAELGGLNPSSRLDLEELLVNQLGLPVMGRTSKGKPSFDKNAMRSYDLMLETMGNENPTAKLVIEYRGYQKTTSSNYKPYLTLVGPDQRIRPNYKQHGTVTGRLSCALPNLQQIPRVSPNPWNGQLKAAFIGGERSSLWEADFSQLEFRLAASPFYGNERTLIEAFNDPARDVFSEMAEQLGMLRHDVKTLTYTILYGGGVGRVSKVFRLSQDDAASIRNRFLNTYKGIARVNRLAQVACRKNGYIKFWSGRRRHFKDPIEESYMAFNAAIQGGMAEIVKRTMIRIHDSIVDDDCRMLLQVNDSLVFEITNGEEDYYLPLIKEVMEDVNSLNDFGISFAVDIHRWGGDEKWTPTQTKLNGASTNCQPDNAPSVPTSTN